MSVETTVQAADLMTQQDVTLIFASLAMTATAFFISVGGFIWKIARQRSQDLKDIESDNAERVAELAESIEKQLKVLWTKFDNLAEELKASDKANVKQTAEDLNELRTELQERMVRIASTAKEDHNRLDAKASKNAASAFDKIEELSRDLTKAQRASKDDIISVTDKVMEVWKELANWKKPE